jgi:hypothetical protein
VLPCALLWRVSCLCCVTEKHWNFGLINSQYCIQGICTYHKLADSVVDEGGDSCAMGGAWVIASSIITLVFLIPPLFLLLTCGCIRIPFPRVIGMMSSALALIFSCVAVSKWFSNCQNIILTDGVTVTAGYAVGYNA